MTHDGTTGTLRVDVHEIASSASDWKSFLKKKEYQTHPLRYAPAIYCIVGSLGCGKSTLIYRLLEEFGTILRKEKTGRVLYYSGSGSDRALEAYDEEEVEIFDKRSKESFITALKEVQNSAQMAVHSDKKINIIVLDDACNDADLLPSSIKSETVLSQLMLQTRHIPAVIIITSQKYNGLPTFARANMGHLFVFKTKSATEKKAVLADVNFTKKEIESALDSLVENGDFLWIQNNDRRVVKGLTQALIY